MTEIKQRLEYLRGELEAERISYDELHELQTLAPHIDPEDVELLEAAGVPEFPDDDARLWLRMGDGSEYEEFGDDFSALADALNEGRAGKVVSWQRMGLVTDNYDGNNYISLFWGDKDAQPIAEPDLDASERADIERRLTALDE